MLFVVTRYKIRDENGLSLPDKVFAMKPLKLLLIILILSLPIYAYAQTSSQTPDYENRDSPVDLLASYYDAINHQEYQRAYNYWENAPKSYNSFVQGFADTLNVQVIVQPPTRIGAAAGSQYVSIPTVLIAGRRDGTQHTYAGCFVTRKSNLHPPDIPQEDVWHLYSASLKEVIGTADIPTLLTQACEDVEG
jgi:hypothetical protein